MPHGQGTPERAFNRGGLRRVEGRVVRALERGREGLGERVLPSPRRRDARDALQGAVPVGDTDERPLQGCVRRGAQALTPRRGDEAWHAAGFGEGDERGERPIVRDGVGAEVHAEPARVQQPRLVVLVHGDFQEVHASLHDHALDPRLAVTVPLVPFHQRDHVALRESVKRELGAHGEGPFGPVHGTGRRRGHRGR